MLSKGLGLKPEQLDRVDEEVIPFDVKLDPLVSEVFRKDDDKDTVPFSKE